MLYNKSLRSLQRAIGKIAAQDDADMLALTVSMLIMCYTEVRSLFFRGPQFAY
jgi:hypothetical protein